MKYLNCLVTNPKPDALKEAIYTAEKLCYMNKGLYLPYLGLTRPGICLDNNPSMLVLKNGGVDQYQ